MRSIRAFVAGAAFVAAFSAPIGAADMTVKGEVVDIACALSKGDGGRGPAHAACAMTCARRGDSVGVITADAVYEITGDYAANRNAKLLDFVAKKVEVTGEVSEKSGKKLIAVKAIKLLP